MTKTIAALLLFSIPAAADTGPRHSEPPLPVEHLGSSWSTGDSGEDRGLGITVYHNHHLNRDEMWHSTPEGGWFLRVRDGLYVRALQADDGHWETAPKERLVWRNGSWRRLHLH